MAEREPRLPLAGSTSVFSSTSIGSGWAMSPRFDSDVDDFWVKLPERPKSATASPRKPPGRPQRRRTSNGGQAGGALEGREKQAVPVKELVPPEVMKKVLDIARGGALVIEMLWSTSSYLPAHNNGQKYKQIAGELQELLEGRLSRGFPLPVLTLESPVKVKKAQGIYDRYSEWERDFNLVPSNGSYAYAVPSRVGAFEVHLVQGIWDPQRCTAALGPHQGPPVTGAWGVVCSACAQRWQGQKPPEVTTEEQKKEYEKQMKEQHSLMHSKLWTRHWPHLRCLVARLGAILLPSPPDQAPVPSPDRGNGVGTTVMMAFLYCLTWAVSDGRWPQVAL